MKKVLLLAAVSEAATGLALLIVPSLVGRLLLGAEVSGVALPVALVAQAASPFPGAAPGNGIIGGQVISDETTPRPIGRAIVRVKGNTIDDRGAVTADDGHFQVRGLPAGRFTVTVAKPGYLEIAYGATRPGVPGTAIALGPDEHADINRYADAERYTDTYIHRDGDEYADRDAYTHADASGI